MKIGDVMRKERTGTGLSREESRTVDQMAEALGISKQEYEALESGESPVERWFPLLCQLAVKVKRPTSRLLAKSGKSKDCKSGQAGPPFQ